MGVRVRVALTLETIVGHCEIDLPHPAILPASQQIK